MNYYVGIDLGGTNIAAGVVTGDGRLLNQLSLPTQKERAAEALIEDMAHLAREAAAQAAIPWAAVAAVGIGAPGIANRKTGKLEYANNLSAGEFSLIGAMQARLPGTAIRFNNDANAAAWGEYLARQEQGCDSLIALTLGTGIGCGIVLNGRIYEGINFAAGEFGHTVIQMNGILCNCGRKGCLEAYASATALIEQTKAAMAGNAKSLLWELCGGALETVEGKTLFDGVRAGDKTAERVLKQYLEYLGTGIVNLVNTFQPQIICLGGGISKAGALFLEPLKEQLMREDYARESACRTELAVAQLSNDAGIIGAALLPDGA